MLTSKPSNSFDYTKVDDVTQVPFKLSAKELGNSFDYTRVGGINFHGNDIDMSNLHAN